MANREVNLTKRIRLEDNSTRFCPVALSANGRIKPGVVLVNGVEERHSEGSYYIEWREGARRVPLSVGTNAADAMAKRLRKEAEMNAVAHGATIAPDPATTGRSLATAIAQYLEDVKTKQAVNRPNNFGRHNKHGCYFTALAYFLESCHKQTLEEIKRRDMLKFAAFLQVRKRPRPA